MPKSFRRMARKVGMPPGSLVYTGEKERQTGEATPAGWEPGKKSLKPAAELVGKVCDIWSPDMAF